VILGGIACFFTLVYLGISLLNSPIGFPCEGASRDGELQFSNSYALVVRDRKSYVLAQAVKGGYIGPMHELEKFKPGTSIHSETCKSTVVRVVADGREIYRLSQEREAAKILSERKGLSMLAIILFVATTWGVLRLRKNNKLP
jgi:hypothetical protein